MKFVDIYQTQKTTRPLVVCRLAWDEKKIKILKGQAYGKALLKDAEERGGFWNPVTGERIPPSRGLAFLRTLYQCFGYLSYIRASKIKQIKGLCDPLEKVHKGGSCDGSFDLGHACLNVNRKEVEMSYGENKLAPSQESKGKVRSKQ